MQLRFSNELKGMSRAKLIMTKKLLKFVYKQIGLFLHKTQWYMYSSDSDCNELSQEEFFCFYRQN